MKCRHRLLCCFLVVMLLLASCSIPIPTVQPLTRIDLVEEAQSVPMQDAARATVRLRLLSEALTVQPGAGGDFFRGVFRYNVQEWSPKIEQEVKNGTLALTVGQGIGSQIPIGMSDEYDNTWDVALATGIPIDLGIDMGTGTADLELSGLSISKLSLTTGKTDVTVAFREPNAVPLSMLRVTAGTGKTYISGLGYANFDELHILGGAGAIDLDFDGQLSRSAMVDIKAGAGEITLRVPDTIGVRATYAGTPISKVTTTGFTEQEDNVYINGAYGQASLTLTIKIIAGVGKVTLVSQ